MTRRKSNYPKRHRARIIEAKLSVAASTQRPTRSYLSTNNTSFAASEFMPDPETDANLLVRCRRAESRNRRDRGLFQRICPVCALKHSERIQIGSFRQIVVGTKVKLQVFGAAIAVHRVSVRVVNGRRNLEERRNAIPEINVVTCEDSISRVHERIGTGRRAERTITRVRYNRSEDSAAQRVRGTCRRYLQSLCRGIASIDWV
jgi:hypothetical protein